MGRTSIYKQNKQAYINVICELKKMYDKSTDELERKLISNAVGQVLRKKTEYEDPKFISLKAKEEFEKHSIDRITKHSDIHEINLKIKIQLDHCNPVNQLVERILNEGEDVAKIVDENYTAIITKEDDDLINKNKYRSKRPNGWQDAYKKSGVSLETYWKQNDNI